jgi:hypothetical protein
VKYVPYFTSVATQKQVKMIRQHGPGKTVRAGLHKQGRKPVNKHGAVTVVEKDIPLLNSSHNHMLQQSRDVYSGFSRHGLKIIDMYS